MSPGPASPAELPKVHISGAFANLPFDIARKARHDNAAAVYHLGTPTTNPTRSS